jgi:glyoxylase-like metal-dependent hydrolase (beta-lactamase superfamily II)
LETSIRKICGIDAHILRIGTTTVTCISDPAPMPWVCDALLVGMTPERLIEAERRLPRGLVDAAAGRITISFNTFLVQTGRNTILVDTGIGNDKNRPERLMWHQRSERYLEALAALGVTPDAVDTVINTHLHADHTGWNTRLDEGRWVPTFPRARYLCAKADLDHWSARYAADRATGARTLFGSFEDSVVPIIEAGLLDALPADAEPLTGLRFCPAPGHSPGMVAVQIDTGADPLHLWADIFHHPVQFLWNEVVSVACTDPAQAGQTRLDALARARADGAIVAGTHLAAPVFGRLKDEAGPVSIHGL